MTWEINIKYHVTIYSTNRSVGHVKILGIPIVAAVLLVNKVNFSDSLKIFIFIQLRKMYRIYILPIFKTLPLLFPADGGPA